MKCYRYVLKRDSCKNIENETVGMSTKVTLIVYIVIVTLFSGCHPENKAMDFLLSNRYLYDYAEKALVDSMGNIVSYSPYDYETLYNAEDTLELLTIFNAVYVKNLTDETLVTEDFIEDMWKKCLRNGGHHPITTNCHGMNFWNIGYHIGLMERSSAIFMRFFQNDMHLYGIHYKKGNP